MNQADADVPNAITVTDADEHSAERGCPSVA